MFSHIKIYYPERKPSKFDILGNYIYKYKRGDVIVSTESHSDEM